MFRLLRVIIRPSNELTQDYLIPSALRDPVALTHVHTNLLRDCEIREKSVQEKPYISNGRKIILSVLSTFWFKFSTSDLYVMLLNSVESGEEKPNFSYGPY